MSTDHPPLTSRYRILEGYPEKLRYANATVYISFRADRDQSWYMYAVREDDPAHVVEIMREPTMLQWSEARYSGFDVIAGSPADKIMKRLVREGGALQMRPGEVFLRKRTPRGFH